MADVLGEVIDTPPLFLDAGSVMLPGDLANALGDTGAYLMQAVDSITGTTYTWESPARDFLGSGYPGPNSPTKIAVSGHRKDAVGT